MWHVEFGSSGGFTGGGTGYRIDAGGIVERWTIYLAGEDPVREPQGQASAESLGALAEALEGLEGVQLRERSSMVGHLSWSSGSSSGRLQWASGARLPEPVARALEAAVAAAASAGGAPVPGL